MTSNILTKEQETFTTWVRNRLPCFTQFFDFDKQELDEPELSVFMVFGTRSQYVLGQFIISVWNQNNSCQFDFVRAAKTLDKHDMEIITDWLESPIWP